MIGIFIVGRLNNRTVLDLDNELGSLVRFLTFVATPP
jgi:hypothetical protein